MTTEAMHPSDYKKIVRDLLKQFNELDRESQAGFAACTLRLAGHDFMDFRHDTSNTGGSDGCINFSDPSNAGLSQCIAQHDLKRVY